MGRHEPGESLVLARLFKNSLNIMETKLLTFHPFLYLKWGKAHFFPTNTKSNNLPESIVDTTQKR